MRRKRYFRRHITEREYEHHPANTSSLVLSYRAANDFLEETLTSYLKTHACIHDPTEYVYSNTMFELTEFFGFHIYFKGNEFGEYIASGREDEEFEDFIEWDMEETLEALEKIAEEEFAREIVECFLMTAKSLFIHASEGAISENLAKK